MEYRVAVTQLQGMTLTLTLLESENVAWLRGSMEQNSFVFQMQPSENMMVQINNLKSLSRILVSNLVLESCIFRSSYIYFNHLYPSEP